MDFNEKVYEKIQAYLDKNLSQEETKEFEAAMAADKDLSREVQLHADMEDLLADTPENNLRKSLEKLNIESIEDTPGFDWKLLALIPIVFAIIGFLMFGRNGAAENKNEIEPITSTQDSVNTTTIDTSAQTLKDTAVTHTVPPTDTTTKTEDKSKEKIETTTKSKEDKSSPGPVEETKEKKEVKENIAFNENSGFESLISNNARRSVEGELRGSDFKFTVRTDSGNSNAQSANITVPFQFTGKFEADEDFNTSNLKVHLFSNDNEGLQNFDMLYSNNLILKSESDGFYSFDFKTNYKLKAGLYYFLVEDASTNEIYYTNKFEVKK